MWNLTKQQKKQYCRTAPMFMLYGIVVENVGEILMNKQCSETYDIIINGLYLLIFFFVVKFTIDEITR